MVSWDIEATFEGMSPHIKELAMLAREYRFSNIEEIRYRRTNSEGKATYVIVVNDRGLHQQFKTERVNVLKLKG